LLAGERGEYELRAGRPANAFLQTLAGAGNDGQMLPEQVWDGAAPTGKSGFKAGQGTFSATPLAWTHAQLIRLAWSIEARTPVELPQLVVSRYG
jgi:glucoamylase